MSGDKRDEDKGATVIPWPGSRATTAAPPPAPASAGEGDATSAGPADGAAAMPTDDEPFGIDAFEDAVRRAVQEKLGSDAPRFPPQGADDLVARVFSALSGSDGKTALSEVRKRLSESQAGAPREDDRASVIDLSAVREARKQAATETSQRVSGALKDSFNEFMANLTAGQSGRTEITLDAQFLKNHGPSLLGNLFQGLASALLQGKPSAPTTAPAATPPAAPGADAAPVAADPADATPSSAATSPPSTPAGSETASPAAGAAASSAPQVQVKVDLMSIIGSLFKRRTPTPPSAPTATASPTAPPAPATPSASNEPPASEPDEPTTDA